MTDGNDDRWFVRSVGRAYDATGSAWSRGPALVYDRLAEALVAASPVPVAGRRMADVGAGAGAASLALLAAGARVVALDLSPAMLRAARPAGGRHLGAVAAEATALPLAGSSLGGAVAAFSFNHLPDPSAGFRELVRACAPGSPVIVSAYAADDDHPAKAAVEAAMTDVGWRPDAWYQELRSTVTGRLATVDGMRAAASDLRLRGDAAVLQIDLPDLDPRAMVGWRMGMAQVAPFLAIAGDEVRRQVARDAMARLGPDPPPVRRSIVVYTGVVEP